MTTKVDVFAFGVVLMELLTSQKALDESLPGEKSHLVTWFCRVLASRESIKKSLDSSLDAMVTFKSICKVAELAGHCTGREPYQRPDMGHTINVLVLLIQQWIPSGNEYEYSFAIDLHMSLSRALERWRATAMGDETFNNQSTTSSIRHNSGLANTFDSKDGR